MYSAVVDLLFQFEGRPLYGVALYSSGVVTPTRTR